MLAVVAGADVHSGPAKLSAEEVFSVASKSVVVVRSFGLRRIEWFDKEKPLVPPHFLYYDNPRAQGSGVVVAPGTIVTNCHVLNGGGKFSITQGDKEYSWQGRVLWDRPRDICLIRLDKCELPSVTWKASSAVSPGQRVYAVGAPQGLELTISEGIISAVRGDGDSRLLQTTAPISPGSSGGGLFNSGGELVGITTFQVTESQNLNFALPAEWIHEAIPRADAAAAREKRAWDRFSSDAFYTEFRKDWDKLEAVAQAWIVETPDDPLPWSYLARAHDNKERYDQAIEAYRHALSLGASDETRVGLARAYFFREGKKHGIEWWLSEAEGPPPEDIVRATSELESVVQVDPENLEAILTLGVLLRKFGDRARGLRLAKAATEINPNDSRGWSHLADGLWRDGRVGEALSAELRAVELAPESFEDWLALEKMARYIGDQQLAWKARARLKEIEGALERQLQELEPPRR